jgi:uncharacterized membrane-anchored protein
MSMNLGYLVSTAILGAIFLLMVWLQIAAKRFNPWLYWATIVATTTVGTTLADFADRSLGIGYAGGTTILFVLLIASLATWYFTLGSVEISTVSSPKTEMFYWVTIMFSQTLGTALGDWTADSAGLGYTGGIVVFVTLIALVAAAYYWTSISRTLLFWAAYVLTRPLGASIADGLGKPKNVSGMNFGDGPVAGVLAVLIIALVAYLSVTKSDVQKAPTRAAEADAGQVQAQPQTAFHGEQETASAPQW